MEGEGSAWKWGRIAVCCRVASVSLLRGYPLSVGPFAWLLQHGYLPDECGNAAINSVYFPVEWAYENIGWYSRVHNWYLRLWGI